MTQTASLRARQRAALHPRQTLPRAVPAKTGTRRAGRAVGGVGAGAQRTGADQQWLWRGHGDGAQVAGHVLWVQETAHSDMPALGSCFCGICGDNGQECPCMLRVAVEIES